MGKGIHSIMTYIHKNIEYLLAKGMECAQVALLFVKFWQDKYPASAAPSSSIAARPGIAV